jgi:type IV pilus assembly protein PilC
MLVYKYKAIDRATGNKVTAEVEAQNEKIAAKLLSDKGMSVLQIKEKSSNSNPLSKIQHRIKTKQKVIFSQQLSTMINAGLPLVQSLNTVEGQTQNPAFKEVIGAIIKDVESGSSLADAMSRHPRVFNGVFVSLVAAGEASGTLDTSLERLANQQEKDAEIMSKVRGAMLYPVIVLFVLGAVVGFMITTVLPQVQTLYDGLPGAKLPFITKMLLAVSHFVIHYWWLVLVVFVVTAVLFVRWGRTPKGRRTIDTVKLNVKPLSPLFTKLYMARFARTGSTLVASGVPMIKMLNTTADAVGNMIIADSVRKATEKVKSGKSLSESLTGEQYFLDLVPDMIRIGEQSGKLEEMLAKVADYYEKEVDNQIKSISTIIEPLLMVVVGIMALIIVAAVLLPIYSLAGSNAFNHH